MHLLRRHQAPHIETDRLCQAPAVLPYFRPVLPFGKTEGTAAGRDEVEHSAGGAQSLKTVVRKKRMVYFQHVIRNISENCDKDKTEFRKME